MSSPAASSSSLLSCSLAFTLPSAAFLAAPAAAGVPRFRGAFLRLPILTDGAPSSTLVTGPGAGRLLRLLAAVNTGVGGTDVGVAAGVVLLRGCRSRVGRADGGPVDARDSESQRLTSCSRRCNCGRR